MLLVWIGIAVLLAAGVAVMLLRKSAAPEPAAVARPSARRADVASPAPADAARRTQAAPAAAPTAPVRAADAPVPPALAGLVVQRAADLPDDKRHAIADSFKDIPRPPRLLDHLLSPGFVNTASSAKLVDLIVAEPLIAAKVLTAVNSPMYGLKSPVSSIGQAVTYLGLNTARSLCLQYILIDSFKADSPARQKRLEAAWKASALASELAHQLSQRLEFEDRGSLVSAVVLSFLGRLATAAGATPTQLAATAAPGLVERTAAEQEAFGLCASQVGRLLMDVWGLPESIVEDAADIDAVLLKPFGAFAGDRADRLALCYVATRLGERLADGRLKNLAAFDIHADDVEFFHLQGYLGRAALRGIDAAIKAPEVGNAVEQMRAALSAR